MYLIIEYIYLLLQVVERVTIFVMDTNDEKPEFQNLPAIISVLEVREDKMTFFAEQSLKGIIPKTENYTHVNRYGSPAGTCSFL